MDSGGKKEKSSKGLYEKYGPALSALFEIIYIGVILYFLCANADGQKELWGWFIDGINIAATCVVALCALFITGLIKPFFLAFKYFVKKPEDNIRTEIRTSVLALKTFMVTALLMNVSMVIVRLAAIAYNINVSDFFNNDGRMTPLITWVIADALPCVLLIIIIYPIYVKLKKTEIENIHNEGKKL